jgi:HNH endonuclease
MGKLQHLKGKRFHSLLVINLHGNDKQGRKVWLCRCDCGIEKAIASRHLVNGKTLTCGCGIGRILPKPALGLKGKKHPKWKGGQFLRTDGYIMEYIGNGKYEMQHRLVWIREFGEIPFDHVIHHKNENKTDNRLLNLELLNRKDHALHHDLGSKGDRSNLIWRRKR